jgi:hypothetical protein
MSVQHTPELGEHVGGSVVLTKEEWERARTLEGRTTMCRRKGQNAAQSLFAAAEEAWGPAEGGA